MRTDLIWTLSVVAWVALARAAGAQSPPAVALPPVNVVLPNYDGVPAGEVASTEAGAFLVRANDTSSIFYNPAGVTHAERSSISSTAGVFQFTSVKPRNLVNSGSSFEYLPSMFAFVIKNLLGRPNWAGGLAVARVNAWGQEMAAERAFESGTSVDRLSYTSSSAMDAWLANIGVGYSKSLRFRIGASLDGQLTTVDRSQTVADQLNDGSRLSAVVIDAKGSTWYTHLRVTGGGQFDVTSKLQVGVVVRSAGLGVLSGGSTSLEGIARSGAATTTASYFEDENTVRYKIPFEFRTGAAYTFGRGQVEVDLLTHFGGGVYDGISSENKTTILTDSGNGTVGVQQLATIPSVVDSRAVVNVAIGGHYHLTEDAKWVLHGGYATDRSPVGEQDTVFTKVHLQKVTLGLSGRTKYFLGSLGLQYSAGTSGPIVVQKLQNGQAFSTNFQVTNVGFVYSLALLF